MKVAVLEWICSGGMQACTPDFPVPSGLLSEGLQMMLSVAEGLARGGVEVALAAAPELLSPRQVAEIAAIAPLSTVDPKRGRGLECVWKELSAEADLSLVIAPEFDGVLADLCEMLRAQGSELINCGAEFLEHASNKLATARLLTTAGIPHPPTQRWSDTEADWCAWSAGRMGSAEGARWVVKPIDGAGCDRLQIIADPQAVRNAQTIAGTSPDGWIVQPWLPGLPLSRSVIVDADGHKTWTPAVSQEFHWLDAGQHRTSNLKYRGCRTWEKLEPPPIELLDRTLDALGAGALGWIGIDLLFHPESQDWTVIEINPRLTTSFVALAQAYTGNLAMQLISSCQGSAPEVGQFNSINFQLAD